MIIPKVDGAVMSFHHIARGGTPFPALYARGPCASGYGLGGGVRSFVTRRSRRGRHPVAWRTVALVTFAALMLVALLARP